MTPENLALSQPQLTVGNVNVTVIPPAPSCPATQTSLIKRGSSQTITDKFGNLLTETSSPLTTTTSVTASSTPAGCDRKFHHVMHDSQNDELEEEEVEIIIDLNATTKTTREEEEEDEMSGDEDDGNENDMPKVEEEILRNIIMHLIPTTKKTFVDDILEGVSLSFKKIKKKI